MPDETIAQNWTCQSLPNLEQSGGTSTSESVLECPSQPALNGALWESFDPAFAGAGAAFPASGSLIGTLFQVEDPITTKGLAVSVTTGGATTFAAPTIVSATTGVIALQGGDVHASTGSTGILKSFWTGDTDSNAVGVPLGAGLYYAAWTFVGTMPSLLATTATNINLNTAVPTGSAPYSGVLRNAVLATALSTAPTSVTLTSETASTYLPFSFLF